MNLLALFSLGLVLGAGMLIGGWTAYAFVDSGAKLLSFVWRRLSKDKGGAK